MNIELSIEINNIEMSIEMNVEAEAEANDVIWKDSSTL